MMPEEKTYSKYSGKEIVDKEYDKTKIHPYVLESIHFMEDGSDLLKNEQSFILKLDSEPTEFIKKYGSQFKEYRVTGKRTFSCTANFDYVLRLSKNNEVKSIQLNTPVKYY